MPGFGTQDEVFFPVEVKGRMEQVEYRRYTKKKYGGHYYRVPRKEWKGAPLSLHKAVWEWSRGLKVPQGYCIHHINEHAAHNDPKNLTCMSLIKHNYWHVKVRGMLLEHLRYSRQQLFNFSKEES